MDDNEPIDETTVGERLREARLAQKMSLETVAAQTRIPTRHLEALENADWASLPAPAYCVGFAKNYANMVGLDGSGIAAELRAEMGGTRQTYTQAEVFEPADPKRAMPKWLMLGAALAVVVVVAVLLWQREADLSPEPAPASQAAAPTDQRTPTDPAPTAAPTPAPSPTTAAGPVVLTARDDVWIKVRDAAGKVLNQGTLIKGQTFAVPPTTQGALLDTGRPEALAISAGGREMPSVGVPGRSVSGVSLAPADLARGGSANATPAPPQ